jgi:hypothetical protein
MIYNLIKKICNDLSCIDSGRLAPRSYFVPFSNRSFAESTTFFKARFKSDRVRVLSGTWDFIHYDDDVIPDTIDTEKLSFNNIYVPSAWQSEGYEKFRYLDKYPFSYKSNIPTGKNSCNSTGIYRRFFEVSDIDKKYIISFVKVCGSFEVYVNGNQVGYSKIAQADFNITEFIELGKNELVVVVHKWSEADLLYGQSKFEITGITGDVLIYIHDKGSLLDYFVDFKRGENAIDVNLGVLLLGTSDSVTISIEHENEKIYTASQNPEGELINFQFSGEFELYSAENPILYDLYITTIDELGYTMECVKSKIGFRESTVNSGVYLYNNVPIKIKGVNYSSEYNSNGKLLTIEDYKNDLQLIKSQNINAIKLNVDVDPIFYEICDQMGLYVIKNSSVDMSFARNSKKMKKLLKKNGLEQMAKNIISTQFYMINSKTCFTLFNLGREETDFIMLPTIEFLSDIAKVPLIYNGNNIVPIFNPSVGGLLDEINNLDNKVVFLSEFACSNGIGCASLKEFQDIIENAPCCMGGCISEFCDQYICGEGYDDCGLFTAERKPYSGAENVKYVFRPLRSRLISSDKLEVTNTNYFAKSDNLVLYLLINKDGETLSKTQLEANIDPRDTKIFDVTLGHIGGDMYLNIICEDINTNERISMEQQPISYQLTEFEFGQGKGMSLTELGDNITIKFDGGVVGISKEIGSIISYKIMGKEMLKADAIRVGGNCFNTNIFRPFVRNMNCSDNYSVMLQDFGYKIINGNGSIVSIEVKTETVIKFKNKEAFNIQDIYTINANGVIDVFSFITPLKRKLPNIDCFGKQLKLPNCYGNITYYGRGKKDNYIDMYEYAPMGLYQDSIDKVAEDYAIAQESGNHTNVHFVALTDNGKNGLMVVAKKNPFHLRVKPYSDSEIVRCYKEKCNDYKQSGIYVDINAFVSGIGSTEGGNPIAKYLVKPSEYALQFSLVPLYKENSYEKLFSN